MSEKYEPENRPGSTASERAALRKRKLGRGLGALMGEARREEPLVRAGGDGAAPAAPGQPAPGQVAPEVPSGEGLRSIPVSAISPLANQPRTYFDEEALSELAASIASRGVVQPIIGTPDGPSR